MKYLLVLCLFLFSCAKASNNPELDQEGAPKRFADDNPAAMTADADPIGIENTESHPPLFWTLLYIPNRVVDLFDIVRFRARVGPGVAIDARATKYASLFAGTYLTAFAGLPGPRMRKMPRLPVGLETLHGAQFSILNATSGLANGPEYSPTEIGLGIHFLLLGIDVGVDPVELLDFVTGFAGVDIREDEF